MSSLALAGLLALALPGPVGAQRPHRAPRRAAAAHEAHDALSDTTRALHLLRRATFGARPGDLAEVLRLGRAAWLERQLHPETIDDGALEARLRDYPAAAMDALALYRAYPPPAAVRRQQRADSAARAGMQGPRADSGAGKTGVMAAPPNGGAPNSGAQNPGMAPTPPAGAPNASARNPAVTPTPAAGTAAGAPARPALLAAQPAAANPARMVADFMAARVARAAWSERQLQEVMTDFWFNHFNVFVGKGADRYLVSQYEREAIRPYVFGRFEDMLRATAQHPAMLVYLDNWMSSAPDTTSPQYLRRQEQIRRFAALTAAEQQALVDSGRMTPQQLEGLRRAVQQARNRKPGLNENYARELMELHTLGVDGGYTQQDVVAVARAFTGWTIARPRLAPDAPPGAAVEFVFRPELHDKGEKVVLGTPLRPGRGMEDGLEVLHMLATSPATAHHIARELVERFVSDTPDSAMVGRIARVFLDSAGDLRAVTRALFTDPGFYARRNVGTKVKTPLEVVASTLRVSGADVGPGPSRALLQTLRTLGEAPYDYSFPTGYPAAAAEWVNTGAMLNRMNFALALVSGRLDHVRLAPPFAAGAPPADTVGALAGLLLPGADTRQLQAAVRADLAQESNLPPGARLVRAAGLILGSPEFQKR